MACFFGSNPLGKWALIAFSMIGAPSLPPPAEPGSSDRTSRFRAIRNRGNRRMTHLFRNGGCGGPRWITRPQDRIGRKPHSGSDAQEMSTSEGAPTNSGTSPPSDRDTQQGEPKLGIKKTQKTLGFCG